MSETRILRDRFRASDAAFDAAQAGGDPEGSAAILCQTIKVSSYPTGAAGAYACNPISAGGTESEGGSASFVADASTVIYVTNLGATNIPQGTTIVAHAVGGRFITRYD